MKLPNIIRKIKSSFDWKYYIIALLGILFACSQSMFRHFVNDYIVKNIQFDYGFASIVIIVAFIVYCIYKLYRYIRNKYNFSDRFMSLLLFISITVIHFRYCEHGYYHFERLICKVYYLDIIWGACVIILCIGIYNRLILREKVDPANSKTSSDEAIKIPEDDKLDYYNDALNVVDKIKDLPYSTSTSIAILAPWGYGKTSYLNLIKYALKEGNKDNKPLVDCEIIEFNPRQSSKVDSIQEDFFSILVEHLKKYDSSISNKVNKYIATLGLYITNPITKFFNTFFDKDKEELKDSIGNTLKKLDKRIIVFIDDLDRLTGEEIIEVLKLIDKNASFSNIIFITAFDETFVSNALEKHTGSAKDPFIDKFFNLRLHLPIRPPYIVFNHLYSMFKEEKGIIGDVSNELFSIMRDNLNIFVRYIHNMREVKNFFNQFVSEYTPELANQVLLRDFILVELIKFKYYDEYYKLSQHEYVTNDGEFFNAKGFYSLKEEYTLSYNNKENIILPQSIDIMRTLFEGTFYEESCPYKSIQMERFYDVYFTNNIKGRIAVPDLNALFLVKDSSIIFEQYRKWNDDKVLNDLYGFLKHIRFEDINPQQGLSKAETFKQFLKLVFLISAFVDNKNYGIDSLQNQILYIPNYKGSFNGLTENEFREYLLDVLYNENLDYSPIAFLTQYTIMLLQPIKYNSETGLDTSNFIIQIEDIKSHNLSLFKNALKQNQEIGYSAKIQQLYQLCIDKIDSYLHIHMADANKEMRDFIKEDKTYNYLHPFYRIYDNDNQIQFSHNLFCKEIFDVKKGEEDENFSEYVKSAKIKENDKKKILMYWKRFVESDSHNMGYYIKTENNKTPSEEDIIKDLHFN